MLASERERNQSEYISVTSTHTRAPPQTVPLTLDLTPLPHLPAAAADAAAAEVLSTLSMNPSIEVEDHASVGRQQTVMIGLIATSRG